MPDQVFEYTAQWKTKDSHGWQTDEGYVHDNPGDAICDMYDVTDMVEQRIARRTVTKTEWEAYDTEGSW